MSVSWTPHRFSGGVLALDTTNTVVHRGDAARSFDRFDNVAEIPRFAAAASGFRSAELGGRALDASDKRIAGRVIAIREATDRLFRGAATSGSLDSTALGHFLSACAAGIASHDGPIGAKHRPFGDPATPIAFDAALAVSGLALLSEQATRRIRICSNCCWLFLDSSRNGSRLWCDMAVCGNRQKAKRHYRRQRKHEGEVGHA